MPTAQTSLHISEGLAGIRRSLTPRDPRRAARLTRQCEVVERYDVRGESRRSICESLRISQRTFYVDRRAVLAKIGRSTLQPTARPVVFSAVDARFREVELLTQVGAFEFAAARLSDMAAAAPDDTVRILALARLAEAQCRSNRIDAAELALRSAHECARQANGTLKTRARVALLSAEAACAFTRQDPRTLELAATQLEDLALTGEPDSLAAARAAVACARVSYYRYIHQEIAASDAACRRSEAALAVAGNELPAERASVLTLRAEIDRYDPHRVHHAGAADARAYALAVQHGLVTGAGVALYNTLIWVIYGDELLGSSQRRIVSELANAASQLETPNTGKMLTAVALGALERYDDAIALLSRDAYHQGAFDWGPANRILQARLLFKTGRFAEAARTAQSALADAERSGSGLEGRALRIRGESLEALGQHRSAARTIGDALDSLSDRAPVHHLLAAYRCAARLSPRRAYREPIASLTQALRIESQLASWADVLRQTAPSDERQDALTPRQREIALMVADGRTNAAIANTLGISRKTVTNHLAAVFERLGLRARWQLTREVIPRQRR